MEQQCHCYFERLVFYQEQGHTTVEEVPLRSWNDSRTHNRSSGAISRIPNDNGNRPAVRSQKHCPRVPAKWSELVAPTVEPLHTCAFASGFPRAKGSSQLRLMDRSSPSAGVIPSFPSPAFISVSQKAAVRGRRSRPSAAAGERRLPSELNFKTTRRLHANAGAPRLRAHAAGESPTTAAPSSALRHTCGSAAPRALHAVCVAVAAGIDGPTGLDYRAQGLCRT